MESDISDLTRGPLLTHIRRLALPASVGYLFNTMYNVVDTYWAGRLSTDALAAISLNFPLFMLAMSLGIGFSGAAGALISNSIGAGDESAARKYLAKIITISLVSFIAAAVILFVFLEDIFVLLNSDGAVFAGAVSYGRIIIIGMPFINMAHIFQASLASRGNTFTYRNVLIGGFLLNIGLDPLFMFTFHMDEAGVAMATVVIQALLTIVLFARNRSSGAVNNLRLRDFMPDADAVKTILGQAVPATMNFTAVALGTFVITWFISAFGRNAVAAYGAAVRVEQIALVPTIGLNMALAAIAGQNNGASRPDRVRKSFKLTLLCGAGLMAVILPPVLIFGRRIISLFTETGDVITMGYDYLLLQGFTFFSYIIISQSNSMLQGLKRPGMIMWMGLYRQILAPAGVFYLLCFTFGLAERGVWIGLIMVNWSAALITLIWTLNVMKKSEAATN